jgi:hypothetical protein
MRTRRRATIEDLRVAVHSLPRTTRIAMLQGMAANDIIAGAYTSGEGICPMLAAHRNGGRTNLISFAKAWDRFAFSGSRVTKPRPATTRELLVLRSHLEASLLDEDTPQADLAAAIQAHQRLVDRRPPEPTVAATRSADQSKRVRPGDPDRSRELRSKSGWSWTRLFRRYDEYQWALNHVRSEQHADHATDAASPQHADHATDAASPQHADHATHARELAECTQEEAAALS